MYPLRTRLEYALRERVVSPFTDLDKRVFESFPTGSMAIDELTGGLPRGAITELYGPVSSGRTSTILTILAMAASQGEYCALVDGKDSFDPVSAAAAGLDLNHLLWIRCHELDQVLRSTDLLLQGGGFGIVVMDLNDVPLRYIRSIPLASWFRFQRTIEKTPTCLVVTGQETAAKSAASLVLRMEPDSDWIHKGQKPPHNVLLRSNQPKPELVRLKNHDVRLHSSSGPRLAR